MSDEITKLRQDFMEFYDAVDKKFRAQSGKIKELEQEIESSEKNSKKYIDALLLKMDRLVSELRRKQTIDRQRLNDIDRTVDFIKRKK